MKKGKYFIVTNIGTMSIFKYINSIGDWILLRKAITEELEGTFHYAYMYIYDEDGMLVYEAEYKLVNGELYHRIIHKYQGFYLNRMWRDVS